MEIRLIREYHLKDTNPRIFEDELRQIWWKTYWAAIIPSGRAYSVSDSITKHAKSIADATIEMISPGTKMIV